MARTERRNSSVCASGATFAATKTTGTRASSQSMRLWRSSIRRGFMIHLCRLSEIEEPTNIDPVDLRAIVDMDQCIRASFAQCGQPTHTNLSTKVRSRSGLSQNDSKTASDSQRLAWL